MNHHGGTDMGWLSLSDRTEIRGIFETIIQKGAAIEVHFPGEEEVFFSRALAVSPGREAAPEGAVAGLVLRDLSPRHGNERIHHASECEILFSFRRFFCRFRSTVLCEDGGSPHPGHLVEYPALLEVEEKRREERHHPGSPGFFAAVFRHAGKDREPRTFELSVLNYSRHGLGLLVPEADFPLLPLLQPGDSIGDLTLYGEALLMNLSATVRHKTEIEEGPNAGAYLLGLRAEQSLEARFDVLSMGSPLP